LIFTVHNLLLVWFLCTCHYLLPEPHPVCLPQEVPSGLNTSRLTTKIWYPPWSEPMVASFKDSAPIISGGCNRFQISHFRPAVV
jgi:hypothetical protein